MKRGAVISPLLWAWLAGCAGQLDLAPEAYQSNAQTVVPAPTDSNNPGAGGSTAPSGTGGEYGPLGSDTMTGPAGQTGSAGPAGSSGASSTGGAGGGSQTDGGAMAPLSACPTGVEALGLLNQRCGACHSDRAAAKNLDLVTAGVAERLVGVKSTCRDLPLLDPPPAGTPLPGSPAIRATGFFLDKLVGGVDGCGSQMPYGTPAFSKGELDCINEWAAKVVARGQKAR